MAKRLAELTPGDLQYTTFGSSGGEAIDFALKLARGYTGRPGVISAEKGYHGHTGLALAAALWMPGRGRPASASGGCLSACDSI